MMRGLCFFLLSILTQESLTDVTGLTGHNVTLPCSYDPHPYGELSFCWGRGKVPRSKCSDTVLSSQDGVVQFRESPRYQLQGSLIDGDISLTIIDAQWGDGGVYGCRVEIPGWFNDHRLNTLLVMVEASVEQPATKDWTPAATAVSHDEQSEMETSALMNVGDATVGIVGHITIEEKFPASLDVGNVARMGVIFFSTVILILVFIFWRSFQPLVQLQHLKTSAAENIYESI